MKYCKFLWAYLSTTRMFLSQLRVLFVRRLLVNWPWSSVASPLFIFHDFSYYCRPLHENVDNCKVCREVPDEVKYFLNVLSLLSGDNISVDFEWLQTCASISFAHSPSVDQNPAFLRSGCTLNIICKTNGSFLFELTGVSSRFQANLELLRQLARTVALSTYTLTLSKSKIWKHLS